MKYEYEDLFFKHKVNIVLQGHVHAYGTSSSLEYLSYFHLQNVHSPSTRRMSLLVLLFT